MPRRIVGILVVIAATITMACQSADKTSGLDDAIDDGGGLPERDASLAQTDSLRYHLRKVPGMYDAHAVVKYVNRTHGPVYFVRCGPSSTSPMYGISRTGPDSAARAFIGPAYACTGSAPLATLAEGDSISLRVWLGSTESPQANPPIEPAHRVGLFRVDLQLCAAPGRDSSSCVPLAPAFRRSNAFQIVFEDP